jgi:hypothetical protein
MEPTPSEAITASFYAWEIRGRGWTVSPYPVALEPPYRPFFLLPGLQRSSERIDDGARPTFFSRLAQSLTTAFTPPAVLEPSIPFEEPPPFPARLPSTRVSLRVDVPPDFDVKHGLATDLVLALGTAMFPVSFEVVGDGTAVRIFLSCAEVDTGTVVSHLEAYLPGVVAALNDDPLDELGRAPATAVIELGLGDECFLPLRTPFDLAVDPLVPLLASMQSVEGGGRLVLRVAFTRTMNPWGTAIEEALSDGEGGCIIADAPSFPALSREKTETPFLATTVRLIAEAGSEACAVALLRRTHAYVAQFAHPHGNELVVLEDDPDGGDLVRHGRQRTSARTGMLLSAAELSGLVRLPGKGVSSTIFPRDGRASVPLPPVARGHALTLGVHEHRGTVTRASLDLESRFAHMWVIGASGTGKSTLLANMVLSDIAAGHGVALLEPHGDLIDDVCARLPPSREADVILFDPRDTDYPIGFNILRAESERERALLAADLTGILRRMATSWGDSMTTVLGEAVEALLSYPKAMALPDVKRFLVDERFRGEVLSAVPDPHIRASGRTSTRTSARARLVPSSRGSTASPARSACGTSWGSGTRPLT